MNFIYNVNATESFECELEYAGNAERAGSYLNVVTASLGAEIAATIAVQPK